MERRIGGGDHIQVVDEGDEVCLGDVFGLENGSVGAQEGFACAGSGLRDRNRFGDGW